ncbi:signal transduction histidine kinase [Streptacidiphilus sp. MAP12-16]|uniref:sensor histidine kinase n=1 Tax=Streptacidiphilus sp. MAP12-16 TaxID=3156300 RepID=UPI003513F877
MERVTTVDPIWGHPQVARLTRAGRRLRQVDQHRPWLLDAALVLVVFLVTGLPDLLHDGPRQESLRNAGLPVASMLALQAALVLPLLWRRRAPFTVFAVIAAVFLLQWSVNVWLRTDVALFLALYTLARHGSLRLLPWACGITVGALVLVAVRVSTLVDVAAALFFLCNAAIAAVALGLGLRTGQAYLAALRDRAARLEVERDQRAELAAAAERTRVAREMHDIIGHNLSVIIGLADGGAYAADLAPERSKEALQLIAGTGRQALGELRRMLGVLRERTPTGEPGPQLSPQPGIADLDALCERVRSAGPQVVYRTVGNVEALDRGVQLTVYRIVQESLTNTLKHAGTDTRAQLTLAAVGQEVRIRVEDTGPPAGAPSPAGPAGEGHGLAGMRERAALYGGTVAAGPRPGGGWTVEALLDLTPQDGGS